MDCDINASKYRCLGLSGYPASSCFAIFHSIVPSAEIQCSGLLESRALKFGMFLWGVPAGPAGCLDWWATFLTCRRNLVLGSVFEASYDGFQDQTKYGPKYCHIWGHII